MYQVGHCLRLAYYQSLYNLNIIDKFSKNNQISNLIKIRPVGAELFHEEGRTDGSTDMTKLIVALHHFANPSNNHF